MAHLVPMIGIDVAVVVVFIQIGVCVFGIISKCGVGHVIYHIPCAKSFVAAKCALEQEDHISGILTMDDPDVQEQGGATPKRPNDIQFDNCSVTNFCVRMAVTFLSLHEAEAFRQGCDDPTVISVAL